MKYLTQLKLVTHAKTHISNNIDNANSARFALSCATSTSVKILKKPILLIKKG